MRILIYGINYAPELTGIGKYTGEMASWLAEKGHTVTMVTAPPYYPEWKIHTGYKKIFWFKEKIKGVTVYRCPLYVPENVTSLKRILHEFSFLASIVPVWVLTLFQKKYDFVLCISPPFHLGLMPLLYAKLKGSKSINHIQDLQVDAAKDLGMIKNKHFLEMMFKMEKFILDKSDFVSTISIGMLRKIESKGIGHQKTIMFPNWVDENIIQPLEKDQSLKSELGYYKENKIILYSGNLGEKQGLEIILDVAQKFSNQPEIQFLICGSGGGKERLITLASELRLSNIRFFPLQPYEKLSALLSAADVHLVLQKKSASDLVMPSKLTGILSAGGCVIVTADPNTSLYDVIVENNIGIVVEPENSQALFEGINYALKEDISPLKRNARRYVEQRLSKENILTQFETDLRQIIEH